MKRSNRNPCFFKEIYSHFSASAVISTGIFAGLVSGLFDIRHATANQAVSPPLSACVSIQGNGSNFPSHLGTYIALLENNIMPAVTIGGSSGGLIGAAMMALVDNPSLSQPVQGFAASLSPAQRAALILAASQDVTNDFLFVPALDDPRNLFVTLAQFSFALLAAKTVPSNPNNHFMNIESAVGQGMAAAEFMGTTDFTPFLAIENFQQRRKALRQAWRSSLNSENVSVGELLSALATSDKHLNSTPRSRELVRRVFFLMREDPLAPQSDSPEQTWTRYNDQLVKWEKGGFPKRALDKLIAALHSDVPASSKIHGLLKARVTLPDPDILWKRYEGLDSKGKQFPIPEKLVLHSTFRKISVSAGRATELSGWENLHQGYMPSQTLASAFVERKRFWEANGKMGYFQYLDKDKQTVRSLFPAERVMILDASPEAGRGLAWALRVSASEPNGFRRLPFYSAGNDSQWNRTLPSPMINFGGWLEFVALGDMTHLPQCANADFFVTSSLPGELHSFGEAAIRGALVGNASIWSAIIPPVFNRSREEEVKNIIELANASFHYQRSLSGTVGHVNNDLDWDNPLVGTDPTSNRPVGTTFQGERAGLLLRSYENTLLKMKGLPPFVRAGTARLNPFGMAFYPDSGFPATREILRSVILQMDSE